jgi:hypothetical protein
MATSNVEHGRDDFFSEAIIHIGKPNCCNTLELPVDCVEHFRNRLAERGITVAEAVIVLLNVDDINGGPLADVLMPGHNWQEPEVRDRREVPFIRGLVMRDFIEEALDAFDKEAAMKLKGIRGLAVVVVNSGAAAVFTA